MKKRKNILYFVKDVWDPKDACAFLQMFSIPCCFREIFSTHLTWQFFRYLLHTNKYIDEVIAVTFVENNKDEMVHENIKIPKNMWMYTTP